MAQLGVPFKLQSIPCKCKPSRIHTLKPSLSDSLSLPSLPTFTTTPSLHAQLSIIPYLRFDPALSHPPASPTNQCFYVRYNVAVGAWEAGAKWKTGETSQWYILDHSPQHWHIRS
ncbi:hypothetical protein AAZX31_14G128500 [Glycine max]